MAFFIAEKEELQLKI